MSDPRIKALAQEASAKIKAVTDQSNAEIETIYRQYRAKVDAITGISDSLSRSADSQPHPHQQSTRQEHP